LLIGLNGFFDELEELRMKNFEEFGDICARNFIIGVKLILSHTVEIQKKGEKLSFPRVIFQLKAVNIGFMFKSDD
jgi:hypothetical protein